MTTSPIPVEQFGTWLGELVTAIQTHEETNATAASPSPFHPGVGNFMHTIGQGFSRSAHDSLGGTQNFAQPSDHSDDSHSRAAARLRHQIIHNLGSS